MAQVEPTPGPWEHISRTPEIVGPNHCSIAVVQPYYKSADVESNEQQAANAELIASAPEMKSIIVQLAERNCEYGSGADCNNLPQGVRRSVCLPCQSRKLEG